MILNITDSAKEYLTDRDPESEKKRSRTPFQFLGGCSGFQYKWELTDEQEDGYLIDNILVVVDKIAEMFILGCTVDYVKKSLVEVILKL